MTHFGLICPATTGHLNTMLPLGVKLKQRGHTVTLISIPDLELRAISVGLNFCAIGQAEYPSEAMKQFLAKLGQLNGTSALRYTLELFQKRASVLFRDVPIAVKTAKIDALLIDQFITEGGSIAEFLEIPFITICSAVVLHQDPYIPPYNTPWHYRETWQARLRNRIGYARLNYFTKSLRATIAQYRQKWNLSSYSNLNCAYSPLAQISQEPSAFEFPRNLPPWFHFTGPYSHVLPRPSISFPYDRLTGQPLIYASMGTIMGRLLGIFQIIARACFDLDVQLIISLGGVASLESLPQLPGNPLIVRYAPQLELLQKASLTITHAGLNTTLEALSSGVPLIAIPVANDGPGVAARICWTGAGKMLLPSQLTVSKLRHAIQELLSDRAYKNNALRLQNSILESGGVNHSVDIIEQAISTGKPVLNLSNTS